MKKLFFLPILVVFSSISIAKTPVPYDILEKFIASGYMGDKGKMVLSFKKDPFSEPSCVKVTYSPSNEGWGGVFWQFPANNWCKKNGKDLSDKGFTKLTFWVKGENGGENVKFKFGHDCDEEAKDAETVVLEKQWKQYSIDLNGLKLTNVTGAFAWIVDSKANEGSVTFYLDDVKFE